MDGDDGEADEGNSELVNLSENDEPRRVIGTISKPV